MLAIKPIEGRAYPGSIEPRALYGDPKNMALPSKQQIGLVKHVDSGYVDVLSFDEFPAFGDMARVNLIDLPAAHMRR